jgi:glycosyltransferase involved in cell wall biosynthesis
VRAALRSGSYDAVICDLTGRATLLTAMWTSRTLRLPLVLWVGIWKHPGTFVHRFSRPLVRRLYRTADAVVTYGSHCSAFVAAESGRTAGVFAAAQSVDNDHFRTPVPDEEVRALRERLRIGDAAAFLYVGRLTEEKGLDYLLRASARVVVPHQIVIAGRGPLREVLEAHAASLGIADRVRFAGQVDQAELPALFRVCDALVLPSVTTRRMREPWGLVVNEAMNCGLPVIATDAVGAAAGGLVVGDETGIVVPERDPAALAHALESLATDESTRRRLGKAASARVLGWNYAVASDAFEAALATATAR